MELCLHLHEMFPVHLGVWRRVVRSERANVSDGTLPPSSGNVPRAPGGVASCSTAGTCQRFGWNSASIFMKCSPYTWGCGVVSYGRNVPTFRMELCLHLQEMFPVHLGVWRPVVRPERANVSDGTLPPSSGNV